MKKSELKKIIREVISEQQSSGPLPPMFIDTGEYVILSCPAGYRYIDNLPTGQPSPRGPLTVGASAMGSPFVPTERLHVSYCMPMNVIDADDLNPDPNPDDVDDLSPNPNPGIPIGKPGMGGGTKFPGRRR